MKKLIYFLILIFAVLISSSYAAQEENFYIKIVDYTTSTSAIVEHEIIFNTPTNILFNFNLPSDAKGVSLKIDGEFVELDNLENMNILGAKSINLEYITNEIIGDDEIFFNLNGLQESNKFLVLVELDKNNNLRYKTGKGMITTSVYPQPYNLLSNGQNIIVKWERTNIEEGSEFSGFILLEEIVHLSKTKLLLLILVLVTILIFVYLQWKKYKKELKKQKTVNQTPNKTTAKKKKVTKRAILSTSKKTSEDVLKHLKGDEKQVVRTVGDFSKATLSRILSELEERNIISKEKKGKKNIVHLK
jgi:DNA-binding HxlR family transcriptional regulator